MWVGTIPLYVTVRPSSKGAAALPRLVQLKTLLALFHQRRASSPLPDSLLSMQVATLKLNTTRIWRSSNEKFWTAWPRNARKRNRSLGPAAPTAGNTPLGGKCSSNPLTCSILLQTQFTRESLLTSSRRITLCSLSAIQGSCILR